MKSCKNCPFNKCLLRVDYEFELCPVEKRKQESKS